MDFRTTKVLLRCVQSQDDRVTINVTLRKFVDTYGSKVGTITGSYFCMTPVQKHAIRSLLVSIGVDPETKPDAWIGLTRTQALKLGNNEKFAQDPVKLRRVAVKSLRPTLPITLNGHSVNLPARCHIEVDYAEVGKMSRHDWIIVVENWESFNAIEVAADKLSFPGQNPLVVWRGDKDSVRSNDMLAMIRGMTQPVAAFVDYDPSGMVIARALPRLAHVVAPPLDVLASMMKEGLPERYMAQIAGCQAVLRENDSCVASVWEVIRLAGRALPQEVFCRMDSRGAL